MSHPKMLLLRVQMFPEPKHWDANQRLPREHWLHKPGLRWNLPGFGVHMAAACCSYGVSRCFKSQGPTHRPRNPHSFPAWKRQTSSNHGDFRVSCSHVTAGPLFPHASAVLPVKWSHTRPWKPRPTCWISYVSKCLKMSQNVSKCLKMSQNVSKCLKTIQCSMNSMIFGSTFGWTWLKTCTESKVKTCSLRSCLQLEKVGQPNAWVDVQHWRRPWIEIPHHQIPHHQNVVNVCC